jgi:hypothetical protein
MNFRAWFGSICRAIGRLDMPLQLAAMRTFQTGFVRLLNACTGQAFLPENRLS